MKNGTQRGCQAAPLLLFLSGQFCQSGKIRAELFLAHTVRTDKVGGVALMNRPLATFRRETNDEDENRDCPQADDLSRTAVA